MKKYIICLAVLFVAYNLSAQTENTLFQQIEDAGTSITSMDCDLKNVYFKNNSERIKLGKFYYQADDKIGVYFECEDYIILNSNKMKTDIGIFHGTFRTDRGKLIKPLVRMLFCAIQGKCEQLAEENNYDLSIETTDEAHTATFTSRKRNFFGIGYRQVIFNYSLENKRIQSIILIDYNGNTDTYQLTNSQYGIKIDEDKFKF